jgi:hypothetical protein
MADLPDGNQLANLSLPGLLGALLAFFVFLPPHPVNTVPVISLKKNFNQSKDFQKPSPLAGDVLRELLNPVMLPENIKAPMCQVQEYLLQAEPHFPPFHPWESQTLQLFLEEQRESLHECLALEVGEEGEEKGENDADERQITALEKERDGSGAMGAQFEDLRSPTAAIANFRTVGINKRIKGLRDRVGAREERIRARDYEIAELKRFGGWLDVRLADPDRLRPEQSLGDYLKALSDHVTGFLALVAGIGTTFKVLISPAGSKLIYKLLFKEEM